MLAKLAKYLEEGANYADLILLSEIIKVCIERIQEGNAVYCDGAVGVLDGLRAPFVGTPCETKDIAALLHVVVDALTCSFTPVATAACALLVRWHERNLVDSAAPLATAFREGRIALALAEALPKLSPESRTLIFEVCCPCIWRLSLR